MRILIAVAAAAVAAALALSSALAGPPTSLFRSAATNSRPTHGRSFTGLTVGYIATPIKHVDCYATLGSKDIFGRVQRFFTPEVTGGPATVSCAWQIPKSAAGKVLRAWTRTYSGTGYESSGITRWRVR